MWLFTKTGYFSVVQDRQNADQFHVRARFREDLERLRDAYLQDLEIKHTPKADYAYRAQIDRMTFGELAIALANDVDYDNFKNAVTREQGHDRHMLYLDVWHTMVRAQDEAEQERMMRISRLRPRREQKVNGARVDQPGFIAGSTFEWEPGYGSQLNAADRRQLFGDQNACVECDLEGCSEDPVKIVVPLDEKSQLRTFTAGAAAKKRKKKAAKKNARARKRAQKKGGRRG